ncbi:hypothetical protein BDV28DRAFT_129693, partial [Aspergillus coremiiformis]
MRNYLYPRPGIEREDECFILTIACIKLNGMIAMVLNISSLSPRLHLRKHTILPLPFFSLSLSFFLGGFLLKFFLLTQRWSDLMLLFTMNRIEIMVHVGLV